MTDIVHHHGLEKGFIGDKTIAVKMFETQRFWIVTHKFTEIARDRFPLRANIWDGIGQEVTPDACCDDMAKCLDKIMADAVQCIGPFRFLIERSDKFFIRMRREKCANIFLAFQREILTR